MEIYLKLKFTIIYLYEILDRSCAYRLRYIGNITANIIQLLHIIKCLGQPPEAILLLSNALICLLINKCIYISAVKFQILGCSRELQILKCLF